MLSSSEARSGCSLAINSPICKVPGGKYARSRLEQCPHAFPTRTVGLEYRQSHLEARAVVSDTIRINQASILKTQSLLF